MGSQAVLVSKLALIQFRADRVVRYSRIKECCTTVMLNGSFGLASCTYFSDLMKRCNFFLI